MRIFLLGDAVGCAVEGRKDPGGRQRPGPDPRLRHRPPRGRHRLLRHVHGRPWRGEDALVKGPRRAGRDRLTDWTLPADQVVPF